MKPDDETKLRFIDIILSPIKSLWGMASSREDVEDINFNSNSKDKIVAELAKNQEKIDKTVESYYGGKNKRKDMLKNTKVNNKDLKPLKKGISKVNNEKVNDDQDKEIEI